MDRTSRAVEHENGLALFIVPLSRQRFRASLANDRRRPKLLRRLSHFGDIDVRFASPVKRRDQVAQLVLRVLKSKGAPATCHVVSNDPHLDGRELPLQDALEQIVDGDSMLSSFVSCIPGRLAYFHDEEIEDRFLLERRE